MADQSDDGSGEQLSLIFAFSKTCVAFARDIFPHRTRNRQPEGLYVISHAGVLSEYALEASGVKQHNRVTDDSPIDVMVRFFWSFSVLPWVNNILQGGKYNTSQVALYNTQHSFFERAIDLYNTFVL